MPQVTLQFDQKLTRIDFEAGRLTTMNGEATQDQDVDFIVGCDGAYSKVREQLMRAVR